MHSIMWTCSLRNITLAVVLPRIMSLDMSLRHYDWQRARSQRIPGGCIRGQQDLELPQPKPRATQTKLNRPSRRIKDRTGLS